MPKNMTYISNDGVDTHRDVNPGGVRQLRLQILCISFFFTTNFQLVGVAAWKPRFHRIPQPSL